MFEVKYSRATCKYNAMGCLSKISFLHIKRPINNQQYSSMIARNDRENNSTNAFPRCDSNQDHRSFGYFHEKFCPFGRYFFPLIGN
jgi:hypothetical protein